MANERFFFEIEEAMAVWHGRFTTLTGRLREGSISVMDCIAVPLMDGTQNVTYVVRLGENSRLVDRVATEPGQAKSIDVQVWGSVLARTVLISGIATRAEPPVKEASSEHL